MVDRKASVSNSAQNHGAIALWRPGPIDVEHVKFDFVGAKNLQFSAVRAGDEVEWAADAHGEPCQSESEAKPSPLSRLWAGDFPPWTSDFT